MANDYSLHIGGERSDLETPGSSPTLTDLSALGGNFWVNSVDWQFLPPTRRNEFNIPQDNGTQQYAQWYEGGTLQVEAVVYATSGPQFKETIRDVMYYLDATRGDQVIKINGWDDAYFVGRLDSSVDGPWAGPQGTSVPLSFKLSRAFSYALTETNQTITVSGSPQAFSVPAASGTSVGGTAEATCVWIIKNTSGGTSSALTLARSTTPTLTIDTTAGIANGTWLKLDGYRDTVETSVDSGTNWVQAVAAIDANVQIPSLKPKAQNAFTLTGLTAGEIELYYRERNLGA